MVETQITELIYNQLSREQFNELVANNEVQEDEFYLVTGDDVTNGADGTTFTPSVSDEGVISWTNNGDLENPPSVNIKGTNGTNGQDGLTTSVTMNGDEYTVDDSGNIDLGAVVKLTNPLGMGDGIYQLGPYASSGITNGLFGMMAGNGSVGMVDFEGIPVMFFGNAAASPEYLIVKVDGDPIDNGLCIADMASETVAPIATKDDLDILEESFEADLAETYTQAVDEAKDYTDEAISAIGSAGGAFDLVIRTQAEFEAMLESSTWLDAVSVCFVGDGGTLEFTNSDAITIPETVKTIKGVGNAIINLTSITSAPFGFGYGYSVPGYAYEGYSIHGITLYCTAAPEEYANAYGFIGCSNLTDCNSTSSAYGGYARSSGYQVCQNLVNCTGMATSDGYDGDACAFQDCGMLLNCCGNAEVLEGDGIAVAYESCDTMSNCFIVFDRPLPNFLTHGACNAVDSETVWWT